LTFGRTFAVCPIFYSAPRAPAPAFGSAGLRTAAAPPPAISALEPKCAGRFFFCDADIHVLRCRACSVTEKVNLHKLSLHNANIRYRKVSRGVYSSPAVSKMLGN